MQFTDSRIQTSFNIDSNVGRFAPRISVCQSRALASHWQNVGEPREKQSRAYVPQQEEHFIRVTAPKDD